MRPRTFLLTNDDGIESPFLAAIVQALLARGQTVRIVAPDGQRSWISKAISRRGAIETKARDDLFGCPAWSVNGTPADCVNLALGHLLTEGIDMVVSGINIGSNAGLPLVLSSGTVGGALEGSLHGVHALASSIRLAPKDFLAVRDAGSSLPEKIASAVAAAAARTADLSIEIARRRRNRRFLVHNLNFPPETFDATPLLRTIPAPVRAGPLFSPRGEGDGAGFGFAFNVGSEEASPWLTDRRCIESGRASHSILDFGRLGVTGGPHGTVSRKNGRT